MRGVAAAEVTAQKQRGKWTVRQSGYDPASGRRRVRQLGTIPADVGRGDHGCHWRSKVESEDGSVEAARGLPDLAWYGDACRRVASGHWKRTLEVQLIETDGLWEVTAPQTLLFLPADLGPTATLLVHRLAYTHPTQWTTEQLGISARKVLGALGRAADREIVQVGSAGILIPTRLGPLPTHMLRNLAPRLRQAHDRLRPE